MPETRYPMAIVSPPRGLATSIHGCEGCTSVVERVPSRSCTRTSTSVIVICSPTISIRWPARPAPSVSTSRRSMHGVGQLAPRRAR